MGYKVTLGMLELIRIGGWMVMGALLVTYFNIDITSNLTKIAEVLNEF